MHHTMELGEGVVEEAGTEMWVSPSRSPEVKGRQVGVSRLLTADYTERQDQKAKSRSREIKVNLVLIKRGESPFVLIAQRMLIAAMCEIDF